MSRKPTKRGQASDPAFTSRELVERIVNEAIAGGAFDQVLEERLQAIADPECGSAALAKMMRLHILNTPAGQFAQVRDGHFVYVPRRSNRT